MRKKLIIFAIILIVLAAALVGWANFYTEYLWFAHLGFNSVFLKIMASQVGIGVGFGALAFLVLGIHILLVRRLSKPREVWTFPTATGEIIDLKEVVHKVTTPVVIAAALLAATIMGYWASRHWDELLNLLNQTPFNQKEPILGKDIGFYLFNLPFLQFVQDWLVYLTSLCAALAAAVYFLRSAALYKDRQLFMADGVRAHLLIALACILVIIAWGWRLEMFELLFSKRGVAYGATYTDVHVNLVVNRIMIGASVLCALFFVVLAVMRLQGKKATWYPAYGLGGIVVLYLIGSFLWPTVVQEFVVNPNELDKERPYLVNAIEGTRQAYNLNKIEVKEFPANEDLSVADLNRNKATIDNIKIWDHRPLKATYKQMQVIRLYYDFPSITVDRYWAENNYWQVMLSPRELVVDQLPDQSQTWVNRHLQYTHGYGVCLSPVKRVVGEGLPDLWIKDIPPESRYPNMQITQPEIYYGQQTTDYVLVKTNTKEFDYPKGAENKYTTYAGEGGVGIGNFWRQLLFAIRLGDLNLLFTSYLTPESKILFSRTIQDRIQAVAPFLMLDQEPYMVVADGRLFWVQDAYTINYRYPYSQPTPLSRTRRINYIRNSVKVVMDAYHGKMYFYLWDKTDPMIQTYAKIFPTLFLPVEKMPASIRQHIRYPRDLFAIQAVMYESFHMTDPQIFYNQEDKWAVSRELGEKTIGRQRERAEQGPQVGLGVTARSITSTNRMDPYYMIMRLPGEPQEEFLLMVPFTPVNKDNMVAWMTARCDKQDYGKLLVYTFPKQKLVFGPMQIEARIDQDEYISQWITLRNQQGSVVIRGDLLVIPIKDSILYVEPIYLQSTQTQLPELKQIIVSFGNRITMKETLPAALQDVFNIQDAQLAQYLAGEEAPASQPQQASTVAPGKAGGGITPSSSLANLGEARGLLEQAVNHYKSGQDKLAKGDWAGYGAEQKALKKVLDQLAEKLQGQIKPPPAKAPAIPPQK